MPGDTVRILLQLSRYERVLGNLHKKCGEDFIFPLSAGYNNKTQYAPVTQSL